MFKKEYSINQEIKILFLSGIAILTAGFLIFFSFSLFSSKQQAQSAASVSLDIYVRDLQRNLDQLVDFNQRIYTSDYDFRELARNGAVSNSDNLISLNRLRDQVNSLVPADGALFIFNRNASISLYKYGSDYTAADFLANSARTKALIQYCTGLDYSELYKWKVYSGQDNEIFLVNVYRLQDMYVCSALSLTKYMIGSQLQGTDGESYVPVCLYQDKAIIAGKGFGGTGITEKDIINIIQNPSESWWKSRSNIIVSASSVPDTPLTMSFILPSIYLGRYTAVSLIIFSAIIVTILIMFVVVLNVVRSTLVFPLNQLAEASTNLEKSADQMTEIAIEPNTRAKELVQINAAIRNLVNQKVKLQNESEKNKRDGEKAMLQYYQIQTRSHFILNCLKSLYGMLETKQYLMMQKMIIAFSNHIRYIFHDASSLVKLSDEIEEVTDYYNIILMDRQTPIILIKDVKNDVMDEMVPPLIVQTFIENSVKHNKESGVVLQIVVQAGTVKIEGCEYLRIKIMDNGAGYDKTALEQLNTQPSATYEQYHVGISNLKRRIQLIYKDRYTISFMNNPEGGACTLILLPKGADLL